MNHGANYVEINGKFVSAGYAKSQAKGISQPVARGLHPELQPIVPQALERYTPKQAGRNKGAWVCHVLIIRYGCRELDDDNLATSYKQFRDVLAAQLGIDDGDPRIKFDYGQMTTNGATGTHVLVTGEHGRNRD